MDVMGHYEPHEVEVFDVREVWSSALWQDGR